MQPSYNLYLKECKNTRSTKLGVHTVANQKTRQTKKIYLKIPTHRIADCEHAEEASNICDSLLSNAFYNSRETALKPVTIEST